ncbi:MAG TPA: VWA domain-containing protein [Acidobacteriaceae bacterium]|jgi:VWFA-related protein|nr:VWA domain-containing protein [Acidobacteriaceae bacterium]
MRKSWLSLVVVCLAVSAAAQKPLPTPKVSMPEAAAPSNGPITLSLVVTDKAGHSVRGLQKSDFTLLDDRQPTEIRSFAAHDESEPNTAPEAVFLVIDEVNTGFDTVSIEREQIEGFLHRNGGHLPVPMALFVLSDNGLSQLTPVSSDGNSLANVLHQKNGELRALGRSGGFYGGSDRLDISLQGLGSLSSYLARARGRKLVIWISPGWWTFDNPDVMISDKQQRKFFSMVVGYKTAMQNADITLYAVDPRGTNDAGNLYQFIWQSYLKPVKKPGQSQPGNLALQVMAQHSGGRVLLGSNDVAGEIAECADDASAWYTITFDPEPADKADTWHDVQVKVDKPDVVVRTSNGYYAQPQVSGEVPPH